MVDLAKQTGTWTALEVVDQLTIPPDMQKLFNKNKTAEKNFLAFPASTRRGILEWILKPSARKPDKNVLKKPSPSPRKTSAPISM